MLDKTIVVGRLRIRPVIVTGLKVMVGDALQLLSLEVEMDSKVATKINKVRLRGTTIM